MQDEDDYVCFTCGGLFPFSFDHQVFRSKSYPSGIVICKPCMRGIAMNKKQRRANKKKAAIRQRRKDRNRKKQLEYLKKKETGLNFMAEFMKIFEGLDLSSFEGDGEGEISEEDMAKMMSQFTNLMGGDLGDLGDIPMNLEDPDFLSEDIQGVTEDEDEGLPVGSE